jgi:DNA-binding CsgD family transcriptional regulator
MANVLANRDKLSMLRRPPRCTSRGRSILHVSSLSRLLPACIARGLASDTLGDFEHVRVDHETALQLAHHSSDRNDEWQALLDLGLLWARRNYAQTGNYYQQALALARTIDDAATLAHSLNHLGNWHMNTEQPQEALRCHQEALATFQALSDMRGKASTLDFLGMASLLSGDLLQSSMNYEQAIVLFRKLDEREREVAALIAQGKSNREIADTLVVGVRTLEAHISNIFSKLGCTSRAQIASWATEKGLTSHHPS